MNEVFVRRVIGLMVILLTLFALSWLLPHSQQAGEEALPSTTIPLESASLGSPSVGDVPPPAPSNPNPAPDAELAAPPAPVMAPPMEHPAPAPVLHEPRPRNPPHPKPAAAPVVAPAPSNSHAAAASPPRKPAAALAATPPLPASHLPAVPPGPLAPANSTPGSKLWFVQIGSYSDHDKAQTTVSLLQNIGYRAEIGQVPGPNGNALQRVRIGPFPSESLADQAQARVAHQGYPESRTVAETRPHA